MRASTGSEEKCAPTLRAPDLRSQVKTRRDTKQQI